MSTQSNPVLDASACPKCRQAPCRALGGAYGRSAILVGAHGIPGNCPLKVSPSQLDRLAGELGRLTLAQVMTAANGSLHHAPAGITARTSPLEAIRVLSRQSKVSVLAAGPGSPHRLLLDSGAHAGKGNARRAREDEAPAEAGELQEEKVKLLLSEPEWIHLDNPKSKDAAERTLTEGAIETQAWCKVRTEGLMPGDGITFTLFLKGRDGKEDSKITTLSGRVGENRKDEAAVGAWHIPSKTASRPLEPGKDQVYFVARFQAENIECKSGPLEIAPRRADCVEVRDALFFHNSALMAASLPEDKDAFLSLNLLAAALLYADGHEGKDCLLYGHADTTGDDAYNLRISKLRAQSVKAMLEGKSADWVAIAQEKSTAESLRGYLRDFHRAFGWDCDPGAGGSEDAPATEAITAFQAAFNREHDGNLAEDGKMGRASWAAVFHILYEQLGLLVEARGKAIKSLKIRFAADGGGIVACGEKFPIDAKEKDGFRSQKNRRVEIAFLDRQIAVPETRREIRLDPIQVTGDKPPAKKVKRDIEIWCQHITKNKKRSARSGQVLEVVPKLASGDDISGKGEGEASDSMEWTYGTGSGKQKGADGKFEAGSIVNPARMLPKFSDLMHLLNAEWGQIEGCHPREDKIVAQWQDGEKKEVTVKVFPEGKISKDLFERKAKWEAAEKAAKTMVDGIGKILKHLDDDVKIKFELLVMKIDFEGGFEEDKASPLAFYKFGLALELKPIIGANVNLPFRFPGDVLPEPVRKYVFRLNPSLSLKGSIDLSARLEREAYRKIAAKVELKGTIGMGIALNCKVFNGKLIYAKYEVATGIEAKATAQKYEPEEKAGEEEGQALKKIDKPLLILPIVVKFKGISGQLTFKVFSGKIDMGSEKLELVKEHDIYNEKFFFPPNGPGAD